MRPLLVAALLMVATAALAAPGDFEVRAYTALAPHAAEDWGAGIAVEIATLPEAWALVGGRKLFGDAVYLQDATALGGSASIRPAAQDNGLRLFAVGWLGAERGGNWCLGLSQAVASW